jgi:small subunit ribosomal protein S8
MSQDVISDALNQLMNMKKTGKNEVLIKKHSKLLRDLLEIAKESGYLDYEINGREMKIIAKNVNEIKAIKPRFTVSVANINKYVRRFLPAKNFGFVIISTNKGLMRHYDAEKNNIGGCVIAYMF